MKPDVNINVPRELRGCSDTEYVVNNDTSTSMTG